MILIHSKHLKNRVQGGVQINRSKKGSLRTECITTAIAHTHIQNRVCRNQIPGINRFSRPLSLTAYLAHKLSVSGKFQHSVHVTNKNGTIIHKDGFNVPKSTVGIQFKRNV